MADDTATAETTPDATSTEVTEVTEPINREDDWQTKARKHERDLKKARREAEELRTQLESIAGANKTEQEKALDQARKEAAQATTTELTNTFRSKLLNAEVRAQAAGRFANPDLAAKVLDLDLDDVFDGDDIKTDVITKTIDEFLEREENRGLKADPTNGRPTGSADGGLGSPGPTAPADKAHNDFLLGLIRGS